MVEGDGCDCTGDRSLDEIGCVQGTADTGFHDGVFELLVGEYLKCKDSEDFKEGRCEIALFDFGDELYGLVCQQLIVDQVVVDLEAFADG